MRNALFAACPSFLGHLLDNCGYDVVNDPEALSQWNGHVYTIFILPPIYHHPIPNFNILYLYSLISSKQSPLFGSYPSNQTCNLHLPPSFCLKHSPPSLLFCWISLLVFMQFICVSILSSNSHTCFLGNSSLIGWFNELVNFLG